MKIMDRIKETCYVTGLFLQVFSNSLTGFDLNYFIALE